MSATTLSTGQTLVQNIKFTGPESEYVAQIRGQVINIQCGEGNHNHGSSKVKLTDRIDYNWELKYYQGHLVAAHINGKIIAYAMKGKDGGMIRVVHQETNGKRALIKHLKEDIRDLAFAYSSTEIILGCVDCEGNIFVYNIEDCADALNYTLLLHVLHPEPVRPNTSFRLAWCPYVPSDEDLENIDESEKMFVVLNGRKAEIYNVVTLNAKYGNEGPLVPNNSYEGYTEINHSSDLIDASFSSDGCAIALACQDGYVKFFQLFMFDSDMQKCLHEWIPHEGKPLTSVIFADNILEYTSHCWKFAITGANNNTELKLWSCESWSCLQTIHFLPNPKGVISDLFLNVAADYTGKYLVVSDINNRGIYVLALQKNEQKQLIETGLIAHFLVPAPFLSFHILEAGTKNIPYCYNNSQEDLYDNDEDDFDDDAQICVQNLKMLVIQPKKFQECNITFQPETLMHKGVVVTENVVENLLNLDNGDAENDGQDETLVEKIPQLDDLQNSVTLLIQQQQQQNGGSKLTLMTPDDFTSSPGKTSKSSSVRNSITNEQTIPDVVDKTDDVADEFQRPEKENYASAGSSPSREVEEILSLNNSSSSYPTQDYFNNLAGLQNEKEEEPPQKDYSTTNQEALMYEDSVNWSAVPKVKQTAKETGNEINKQDLETVYFRMSGLDATIRDQTVATQELREDIKALSHLVNNLVKGSSSNKAADTENIGKELDAAMSKQHLQIAKMLENLVQLQKVKEREFQDHLLASMSQLIAKSLAEKVPQIVQHEIKHTVLPSLHQTMEAYRHQFDVQFNHKFANVDGLIKESFSKALNSKTFVDTISVTTVNMMMPILEKSYKDVVAGSLVPSFERVCAQLFQQVNETFSKGTKEYMGSVEAQIERQRNMQDKSKDLVTQMQAVSENLASNTDRLSETLSTEFNKQFVAMFKGVQDKLVHNIRDVVGQEVKQGFKHSAALIEEGVLNAVSRSRAVTPAPHADSHVQMMVHVQQALAKRAYDEAFQLALSAENLQLVIFVCERVDVNKVFGELCLLNQSVLLALIQQLSMELHKNTETKLCFIRAAFLALLPDVEQTKHFIPKLLKDLIKQLTAFMQANPPLKQMTEARLLKMAVESMLNSFGTY